MQSLGSCWEFLKTKFLNRSSEASTWVAIVAMVTAGLRMYSLFFVAMLCAIFVSDKVLSGICSKLDEWVKK